MLRSPIKKFAMIYLPFAIIILPAAFYIQSWLVGFNTRHLVWLDVSFAILATFVAAFVTTMVSVLIWIVVAMVRWGIRNNHEEL